MLRQFIIIFLLSITSCKAQKITIEHISSTSNKPIYTLIITKEREASVSLYERVLVLNSDEYRIVYNYIANNNTEVDFEIQEYPFGSFKITFDKKKYILKDSNLSKVYFEKLIKLLQERNMKKASEEIKLILSRL
jgi:hypothetical protein